MTYEELKKQYGPAISRYAKKYGVDETELYATILTESSGNPDALSDKDARGLGQLRQIAVNDVARIYNSRGKVDPVNTENLNKLKGRLRLNRNDPEQNIHATAAYLKALRDIYGFNNLQDRAGAYNLGPTSFRNHQKQNEPLPEQTINHMPRVANHYDAINGNKALANVTPPRRPSTPVPTPEPTPEAVPVGGPSQGINDLLRWLGIKSDAGGQSALIGGGANDIPAGWRGNSVYEKAPPVTNPDILRWLSSKEATGVANNPINASTGYDASVGRFVPLAEMPEAVAPIIPVDRRQIPGAGLGALRSPASPAILQNAMGIDRIGANMNALEVGGAPVLPVDRFPQGGIQDLLNGFSQDGRKYGGIRPFTGRPTPLTDAIGGLSTRIWNDHANALERGTTKIKERWDDFRNPAMAAAKKADADWDATNIVNPLSTLPTPPEPSAPSNEGGEVDKPVAPTKAEEKQVSRASEWFGNKRNQDALMRFGLALAAGKGAGFTGAMQDVANAGLNTQDYVDKLNQAEKLMGLKERELGVDEAKARATAGTANARIKQKAQEMAINALKSTDDGMRALVEASVIDSQTGVIDYNNLAKMDAKFRARIDTTSGHFYRQLLAEEFGSAPEAASAPVAIYNPKNKTYRTIPLGATH